MGYANLQLRSIDGVSLVGHHWMPDGPANAVIVLIHGMGEHSGRYAHVAAYFNTQGWAVMAIDLRGHGKSGGKRGHTPSYSHLMDDIQVLMDEARRKYPAVPLFLYGHSMGGNLVLNYVIRRHPAITGLLVSAPYLRLGFEPPAWKVSLGKLAARIYPALSQTTGLEVEAISHDAAEIEKYKQDPLNHDIITASFFVNVHTAGPYAISFAKALTVPTLIMHGTADRLTSPEGSKEFVKAAGANVTLKLWEGFYHEMHNEPEKQEVFDYMGNWIHDCLKKP